MTQFESKFREVGHQMIMVFLLVLVSLVFLSVGSAQAELVQLPDNLKDSENYSYDRLWMNRLLVNENTVHLRAEIHQGGTGGENICFELDGNNQLIPCTAHCTEKYMYAAVISPTNKTYGITDQGEIYRWTPGEESAWEYQSANPSFYETFIESIENHKGEPVYFTNDQDIYEVYQLPDSGRWCINAYEIKSGEKRIVCEIPFGDAPKLFFMPDGALRVGYNNTSFLQISEDGKMEKLFVLDKIYNDSRCESVLYRENVGCLVLIDDGLYVSDEEGNTKLINYVPAHRIETGGQNQLVYLPERDAVIFLSYKANMTIDRALYIIPMKPQNIVQLRLGGIPLSHFDTNNAYGPAFESANPSVKLVSPAEYNTDKFTDVAQWLTGKDGKCDLFLLHTADDGVQNVIRKGYFAPLQDDPDLTAYVEELYPGWRELVMAQDGALAALPMAVGGNTSLGYHRALWEQEELGSLPTTYAGLLDCIQRWDEEGKLELLCLFGYRKNTLACLTDMLLAANAAHYASQGLTPVYSNETLLSLLDCLDKMRPQLRAYDEKRVKGQVLIENSFTAGPEVSYQNRDYTTLYLGFECPEDVTIPRTLYAYVINPYSQHQAEAKAFLNTLTHQMDQVTRFGLVDGDAEGLEMEQYAESVQLTTKSIEEAKAALEEARAGGNSEEALREMESTVTSLENSLAYLQENRYDITPEAAAGYRRTMERAAVTRADGFTLVKGNAQSTLTAFNDGKISPEELCRKLDEVVRMWVMENE